MAELVDALVSDASEATHGSSSLLSYTKLENIFQKEVKNIKEKSYEQNYLNRWWICFR